MTSPTLSGVAIEAAIPGLLARVPAGGTPDPDVILERFLAWVSEDLGLELFPAQEEALLELMAGRHLILNTPTGSGKSLVATGLHFKALCEGRTSFYTSPIKALAHEKFFALCQDFGAENVGMLTGDASINPGARILCCTAEVLSNMALRHGAALAADYVVMDEFHYYSDAERGVAWQVPLLSLPNTVFLLMSATLGNCAPIQERLERQTGRQTAVIVSTLRPVPLQFEYRETPIHETVQDLLDTNRAPIYVVNFTQRECAELAQSLTSLKLCTKEERQAIFDALGGFRFDTAYGKEMRRFIGFGIGIHHAGLLPKYRLLVEQLSQQGLLKAICGTDTLGVGVNIPIRTVLFRKLCKYDGNKVALLSVRDFRQIAGRAGRKGFDERGWVVCQAPEHVIENRRLEHKHAGDPRKAKKAVRKKAPDRGFVPWDRDTFQRLVERPPETLESRFRLSHGMILNLIQRDAEANDPERSNFHSLRQVLRDCHEHETTKQKLLHEAARLVRSLARSGILRLVRDVATPYFWVTVNKDLQIDFSLHQNLSLYLVEALEVLDPEADSYALDVLSLAESILEDPEIVLRKQVDRRKDQLVAQLKAEGVPYEERMAKLEQVTHPKPNAELIYATFNRFREAYPWLSDENIRPKAVGRELFEGYLGFEDFIRHYGLQRSEGVVLRYLSQLFKTLTQTVPDSFKTDEVYDLLGFLRALVTRVDTSLLQEWESLLDPTAGLGRLAGTAAGEHALKAYELFEDERAFRARMRGELHALVRALVARDWEEAVLCVRQPVDPAEPTAWSAERFAEALAPYFEQHAEIVFTPVARQAQNTSVRREGPRAFSVRQVLVDPEGENLWCLEGRVDHREVEPGRVEQALAGPLFELHRIGV